MDMAASVLEKPEKQACFSISQGSVACSVCLEVVTDAGERSIAKLKCGHHFHLDCIGSAFNAKGAMQCPNCRHVEDGQWLYANGCRPCDDFTIDDISYEDDYEVYPGMPELVSAYDEFQANHVQWCPYQHFGGSYPQLSFSLEDFEGPPGVGSALGYTDLIVNVLYGEHPTSSGHACPYLATQGTMVPGRLVRQGEDIHNLPPVTHGHADMSLPAANGGTGMTDPGPGSQSFLAPDRGRSWTRRAVGLSGPSGHDDTQPGLLGLSPLERVRSWSRPEAERPPLPGPVGHVSGNHSGAAIQFGYGVRPVEGGSSSVLHENAPCPRNYYMHGPGGGSQLPQIASPPIRHGVISNQSRRPRHRNAIATPLMSVGGRGIQPAPPPEQARRYAGVWGGGSGTQGQDPNLMVEGSGWHGNSQGFGWRREASQMGVAPSSVPWASTAPYDADAQWRGAMWPQHGVNSQSPVSDLPSSSFHHQGDFYRGDGSLQGPSRLPTDIQYGPPPVLGHISPYAGFSFQQDAPVDMAHLPHPHFRAQR